MLLHYLVASAPFTTTTGVPNTTTTTTDAPNTTTPLPYFPRRLRRMVSESGRIMVSVRRQSLGEDVAPHVLTCRDRRGENRLVIQVTGEVERIEKDSRENLQA